MQAMTFMAPPQPLQVSMSILKTRLSRCAHVIDARRCAGVAGSSATLTLLPLPRFAGVTNARCEVTLDDSFVLTVQLELTLDEDDDAVYPMVFVLSDTTRPRIILPPT